MTPDIQDEQMVRRSAASFFNDNKAIAGFINPTRSLFTAVRELVENALDAAEKAGKLPDIEVQLDILPDEEVAQLLGVKTLKKRSKNHQDFVRLTVTDNGIGMKYEDIPDAMGRVLTGSNYLLRQTRGRFGLGAKMVLLYAQSTVHIPIHIESVHINRLTEKSIYDLFINLKKNEPEIVHSERIEGNFESGTKIQVVMTGAWGKARKYIHEYFDQLAMITPYMNLTFRDGDGKVKEYKRSVNDIPPLPVETKLHPKGCDMTTLKDLISRTTAKSLKRFMMDNFQNVGPKSAEDFLRSVGLPPTRKSPKSLTTEEMRRLVHEGFWKYEFLPPDGACLSPLGADRLRSGIIKELKLKVMKTKEDQQRALLEGIEHDWICAVTRKPKAYEGHPFQVEVALVYRHQPWNTDRIKLYRFANRIPLIYGEGNDVSLKVINQLNWADYKVHTADYKHLAVFVSIVSTKIPFPETSKEYISDVPEIRSEIKLAIQECARKLRVYLTKKQRANKEQQVLEMYRRYAIPLAEGLAHILKLPVEEVKSLIEKEINRRFKFDTNGKPIAFDDGDGGVFYLDDEVLDELSEEDESELEESEEEQEAGAEEKIAPLASPPVDLSVAPGEADEAILSSIDPDDLEEEISREDLE